MLSPFCHQFIPFTDNLTNGLSQYNSFTFHIWTKINIRSIYLPIVIIFTFINSRKKKIGMVVAKEPENPEDCQNCDCGCSSYYKRSFWLWSWRRVSSIHSKLSWIRHHPWCWGREIHSTEIKPIQTPNIEVYNILTNIDNKIRPCVF